MSEITTVGFDLAKNVFQAHGAEAFDRGVHVHRGGFVADIAFALNGYPFR